ncbi:MAG: YlxR family protein [Desulfovibrio sp.]|nr:YlxR family protein [Desulfovibrio sp.]
MSEHFKSEPVRMCVICRRRYPKAQLIRYVLSATGGMLADERKIMPGRGWYCCQDAICREKFGKFRPRGKIRSRGDV